jgi:2-deoxy-D-gluconate 3-dehydrogenase
MGKSDQASALFQAIEEKFGKLDILVNNVGTNLLTPSVVEADEGLWDKLIETNLKSAFLASSMAYKLMKKAGAGKIINLSSIAARKAARGMGIYCIAKAGLEMLTKVLAVELASDHIQVNAVAPCVVRTQFSQPLNSIMKEILRTILQVVLLNRVVWGVLFWRRASPILSGEVLL